MRLAFKTLCLCASVASLAAVAQQPDPVLSPEDKANLRAAHAGYPQPPQLPPSETNRYRTTVALATAPLRTQTLALVTVTIITRPDTVLVHQTNGEMKPYLAARQPVVISVFTQRFDVFHAPEVKP